MSRSLATCLKVRISPSACTTARALLSWFADPSCFAKTFRCKGPVEQRKQKQSQLDDDSCVCVFFSRASTLLLLPQHTTQERRS